MAKELKAPLDVFPVRKLGVPGHEELAMGAIASGGVRVVNEELVNYLGIPDAAIDAIAAVEQRELERRAVAYRYDRPPPRVKDRVVILIDDGLATGSTMRAAARSLRQQNPRRIVVAVPVSSPETCDEFRSEVDEVVCVFTPENLQGVSLWYEDFSQTSDEEVNELPRERRNQSTMLPRVCVKPPVGAGNRYVQGTSSGVAGLMIGREDLTQLPFVKVGQSQRNNFSEPHPALAQDGSGTSRMSRIRERTIGDDDLRNLTRAPSRRNGFRTLINYEIGSECPGLYRGNHRSTKNSLGGFTIEVRT